MKPSATNTGKQLSLLGFFAITASMVMAVYEYPTFATSGFSLVCFLLLGGLLWFIPVGLCAAEMATVEGWEEGGVFTWVSNTLGEKWGFAAISFGYLQIAVGFIPMLYFVLGALSYILNWPALNTDPGHQNHCGPDHPLGPGLFAVRRHEIYRTNCQNRFFCRHPVTRTDPGRPGDQLFD